MRSPILAAVKPAMWPPKEKPASRNGRGPGKSCSSPATMTSALLAGIHGSGGIADWPSPGRSGTQS